MPIGRRYSKLRLTLPLIALLCAMISPSTAFAVDDETPEVPASTEAPPNAEGQEGKEKAHSSLSRALAEQGEAELNKSVRVFQQRYLVKNHRLELLFGGGTTLNDPLVHHYSVDASLLFHISEQWSIGVDGGKYFGTSTQAIKNIQLDYGLFPEQSVLQAAGMLEIQYAPLVGKFSSFGLAVLQLDGYVLAGGGVIRSSRSEQLKPIAQIGAGLRLHLLRWLSISAEVRDLGFYENFQTCPSGAAPGPTGCATLLNHVFAGIRLGLWLPPTVHYRYQR